MKIIKRVFSVLLALSFLNVFSSCKKTDPIDHTKNAFNNGSNERNMIVVISDIHLGADIAYAECNKNLGALEKLLTQIKSAPNVKELVVGGDLLDEWFVPAPVNTYQGKDQADFVKRIATTNKGVVDAFNQIIKEGKITVTYVPGNHDLTITAANVESIFPGIKQARDAKLGLGTYSPAACPTIAIEHGHRYNFFCAPDPLSNQDIAPGTILPPGYFYTRIAALHVVENKPQAGEKIPVVTPNVSGGESQDLLYRYWKIWAGSINQFAIKEKNSDKIIKTNVNGFTGEYSINDVLPYQTTPGGLIDVNLYKGFQDNWETRQTLNNVAIHTTMGHAIDSVASCTETDRQANIQYFLNPKSDKKIVIFGHTHEPKILASESYDKKKCIYVNSGTWIDHNPNRTTANFVVVTPQNADASSQTLVKLYNFENEVITEMAKDSLRY